MLKARFRRPDSDGSMDSFWRSVLVEMYGHYCAEVEEERAAKRHRQLAELEAQDEAKAGLHICIYIYKWLPGFGAFGAFGDVRARGQHVPSLVPTLPYIYIYIYIYDIYIYMYIILSIICLCYVRDLVCVMCGS